VRTEAGIEFFRLIGTAAHNRVIASLADLLADIMRNEISDARRKAFRPELTPVRRTLLQSLRVRDEVAAGKALDDYLDLLGSALIEGQTQEA
jgi:DNA-binding FadR family transcriptional regulator